jgi:peptidoglycan/xylan/chitin deacetylase (PgdA/CDA1 family)
MQQEQVTSQGRGSRVTRPIKLAVLFVLKFCGVFALARFYHRRHIRVLCYHGAWIAHDRFDGDSMFIRPETFEARLRRLQASKFNVISLDQAVETLRGQRHTPDNAVVITMDDGWFGSFLRMIPALRRHSMPATLYCDSANLLAGQPIWHMMAQYLAKMYGAERSSEPEVQSLLATASDPAASNPAKHDALHKLAAVLDIDIGRYVSERAFSYMTPAELKEAAEQGLAVELHTHHHTLHDFEPDKVEQEITLNRRALADVLGRDPQSFRHFCYPSGATAPGVQNVLERLGICSATTLTPGLATANDDRLLLPRIIDGDHRTALEFEAELCGVSALLRNLRGRVQETRSSSGHAFRYAGTH